ncbi:MAG: selenium metabolism-associated LysR family transcriptional regulator [Thermodesulfobacteriota bacterium]|nr:selenium metabolism-associated LysR family transcriptional regulator [Thermodesulfobacteriota bacterium]
MNLKHLELFCEIAEKKSFSKAAGVFSLTQPTLTEHIKSLEENLGLRLFDRLGREVLLTKGGEVLYGYAKKIIGLKLEAKKAIDSFKGKIEGGINIGASTIPGEYILPSLLKDFLTRFPKISVNLEIADTTKILERILNNQLELGITGAKIENSKLEYERFMQDELVLVAPTGFFSPKDKSVSLKRLKSLPFIFREKGSGTRIVIEKNFKNSGFDISQLNIVAVLGSTMAVMQAVKKGVGVSIVSHWAAKEYISSSIHLKIDGLKLLRDFYLVLRRGKSISPIVETFIGFLLNQSPNLSLTDS